MIDAFAGAHGDMELPADITTLQKPGFIAVAGASLDCTAEHGPRAAPC